MMETFRSWSRHLRKNRGIKAFFQAAVIILAVAFIIPFLGAANYQIQGISVKAYVKPSLDGHSYLKLPPLGDLSADTHHGPVDFFIELTGIHPDIIEKSFSLATSQEDLMGNVQSEINKHLLLFLLKQVLVGTAVAALIYAIVFRPPWKKFLVVSFISFGLLSSAFGYSAATYSMESFKQPRYRGAIAAGPEVLLLADKIYDKFQNFKDKTDEVAGSINTLFSNIDGLDMLAAPEDEKIKILIVSDISNNPVGMDLTETLVKNFKTDMVIDAGDLTDFGSALEAQAFNKIGDLGIPYLFVPGNHDSPEVTAFLQKLPNVRILEGSVVKTKGLSILGSPDPWSHGFAVQGTSEEENQEALTKQMEDLRAKLEQDKETDIAVIHNPAMVDSIKGLAPVVIAGHTHKLSIKKDGNTLFLNPGTTGASGFRGLQAEEMSYSALILHLDPEDKSQAVVDIIQYDPLSSSITAQRRLF